MADDEILQAVRAFLDRDYADERRLAALLTQGEDRHLLEEAAAQGWFGLVAPEADDGLGLHPAALVPLFRLFGRRLVTGPLLEQMLLPGLLLRTACADDARTRLAAALTGGRRVAVLDPGVTLDWRAANGSPALDSGLLAGSVDLVRFGAVSDLFVAIVDDGPDGTAAVLVLDRDRPGITVTGHRSTDPGASSPAWPSTGSRPGRATSSRGARRRRDSWPHCGAGSGSWSPLNSPASLATYST
ncbi:hypothetical protein SHIRM173S_06179 [Streptomyces hirsutus]